MPNYRKFIVAGLAGVLVFTHALAAEADVEAELYRAAKLHKGGDTPTALVIWRKWAQQGNIDAAYNLAVIHQHADGVAYDPVEAARWYRHAGERGDVVSQVQLGLMYQNGEGMPADDAKAHEWFIMNRRAHAHHHHNAQYRQWQAQAKALTEERDRREALVAARRDGGFVLAELRRRAGMEPDAAVVGKLALAAPSRAESAPSRRH